MINSEGASLGITMNFFYRELHWYVIHVNAVLQCNSYHALLRDWAGRTCGAAVG